MGPSAAQPGIPFPGPSSGSTAKRDTSLPRSIASETAESNDQGDMDVDEGHPTPTKRNRGESTASLPSIKNLFGIERAEPLASVRREGSPNEKASGVEMLSPGSPLASHDQVAVAGGNANSSTMSPLNERGIRGHASSNSFSGIHSLSHAGSSSSLGPIRTRNHSNASSYSRGSAMMPGTPPRHAGHVGPPGSEDLSRRRVDSRSRQAQALKGLIFSPPSRRLPLEGDGASDYHTQRRSGHRPGSSSSGSLSTMFSQISTTEAAPRLPPSYPSSTHTSFESVQHDGWGAASARSDTTSPRTSWHSRSSTLESGESGYKMMSGPDRGHGPLLPPFRENMYHGDEKLRRSPEQGPSTGLSRHRSLRTPGASANLTSGQPRPRARTLTHTDRPIAPLPNSDDPARRQRLEAASELLRMGQQGRDDASYSTAPGRQYSHKHSLSMQERMPMPTELYENPSLVRSHRPKSHSMSGREFELRPPPPLQLGMYPQGLEGPPLDRYMGPSPMPGPPGPVFDSFHPRRGRGAGDDGMGPGPGGAGGWVFPRRPMPSEPVDVPRSAFQAQMMRGQGLASVPDGIIPAHPSTMVGGSPRTAGTTGTIASGQAKYECAWCGKRFSRPSSLKIHHHSHTGEKPFVCNEPGCGRSFSVQSNLRRHQKCHGPGGDQSESGSAGGTGTGSSTGTGISGRSQQSGAGHSRGDEAMWGRGPPPPAASSGARLGPMFPGGVAGPPPGWHHPHQHPHQQSYAHHPPGMGPAQIQVKDHPPLSRSAYEPGSRSMTAWHERHRGEEFGGQMRERQLSGSSAEEEDELDEYEGSPQHLAERAQTADPYRGQEDGVQGYEDEDDHDKTVTSIDVKGPRPRSSTSSSTTSNIRVGFGSLLNPTKEEGPIPASAAELHSGGGDNMRR